MHTLYENACFLLPDVVAFQIKRVRQNVRQSVRQNRRQNDSQHRGAKSYSPLQAAKPNRTAGRKTVLKYELVILASVLADILASVLAYVLASVLAYTLAYVLASLWRHGVIMMMLTFLGQGVQASSYNGRENRI